MATKNNPKNKGSSGEKKFFDGKEIEPIKYDGSYIGHGKYMASKYAKTLEMVIGKDGKPVAWSDIEASDK